MCRAVYVGGGERACFATRLQGPAYRWRWAGDSRQLDCCGSWTSSVCDQNLENGVWTNTDFYIYIVRLETNDTYGINTIDASDPSATFATYPWAGSWLVRPVPEPAGTILMLLGLGSAVLARCIQRTLPSKAIC